MQDARRGLRIQDSLYGTIDLNHLERGVIDSPSFQRLLSIKQLGYAYAVFPGGDYSRFTHSIGANHVMQKLIHGLEHYGGYRMETAEAQLYRFAALLHDVGHYPFSHALEYAVKRRYGARLTGFAKSAIFVADSPPAKSAGGKKLMKRRTQQPKSEVPKYLKHEDLGEAILEHDKSLREAIRKSGCDPSEVLKVFGKKTTERLTGLISSDVDADRLDFLKRTALHTGLPYGRIDQDYIVREVRVDKEGRLCWTRRALGALDHMLIARFYDYQQVVYNKTVVAFEAMLKDVVYELTSPEYSKKKWRFDLSGDGVVKMIESKEWFRFDDHRVFERIKDALDDLPNGPLAQKCEALLYRRPPTRVAEICALLPASSLPNFEKAEAEAAELKKTFEEEFQIKRDLWWIWAVDQRLTSYEGYELPSEDDEGTLEMVRLSSEDGKSSTLAVRHPESVVGELCCTVRFVMRIYVLADLTAAEEDKIQARAQERLDSIWKKHSLNGRNI